MPRYVLVDVDGTLIPKRYNTTYHLLMEYFAHKRPFLWVFRYILVRWEWLIVYLISKILPINRLLVSKIILTLSLSGVRYDDLYGFITERLSKVPLNVDVISDVKKFKQKGYKIVVLSATIEPVSNYISHVIGADSYIGTILSLKNGKIISIKTRHLGDTKYKEVIKNKWKPYIYYTDDTNEKILIKNAEKAIIVNFTLSSKP
ncbi:HAD family hydrolase [Pyrococcus kukulkanii]|uniref:hypothetical protein n=1 Tax=Pyrococcus kukulkanii TaxID=1609559 RepID=UPI00356433F1